MKKTLGGDFLGSIDDGKNVFCYSTVSSEVPWKSEYVISK